MGQENEVARQRVKITGIQLVDDGNVSLSMVDATEQPVARSTRTRGGRMVAPAVDPVMHNNGTGYTRTVPMDDESPYRPGEFMTILVLRGDHTEQQTADDNED